MYYFVKDIDEDKIVFNNNGIRIGYFENNFELERFKKQFNVNNFFKLSDIFIGNVIGDDYYIIESEKLRMDIHCLSEIIDIHKDNNFNKIVYYNEKDLMETDPNTLVYVFNPRIIDNKVYKFNTKPKFIDIKEKNLLFNLLYEDKCKLSKGHMQLYEYNGLYYNVYINDLRSNIINILDCYENLDIAKKELVYLIRNYSFKQKNRYKKNRDFQKEKLYSWENKIDIDIKKLSSLKECQVFVNKLISLINDTDLLDKKFNKTINVKIDNRLKIHSYAKGNEIYLAPEWGLNELTLIHELSHIILKNINSYMKNDKGKLNIIKLSSHGPEFCATFINVLSIYYDIPIDELVNSAESYGLKIENNLLYKKEFKDDFNTKRFK